VRAKAVYVMSSDSPPKPVIPSTSAVQPLDINKDEESDDDEPPRLETPEGLMSEGLLKKTLYEQQAIIAWL
jgi:hypothetical protein